MRILITGATGLIGKEIGKVLAEQGHDLFVVSRSLAKARETLPYPCEVIVGDLSRQTLSDPRLELIEAVINLVGEPVVGVRWNPDRKEKIYNSRVESTKNLIASLPKNLKVFVGGSAIGIYGNCGNELLSEEHPPGEDFLSKVCIDWEAATLKAPGRKVIIRTGIVLSPHGGALEEMLFPFRAGLGGMLGDGQHWMSWIHIKDIVGLFIAALENNNMEGPYNGAAPYAVTNEDFSKNLAQALGKRLGPSVPALALKVLFGEAADVMVSSIRGSAEKVESTGYKFHYLELKEALDEICAPYKAGEEVFYSEQFVPEPPEKIFPFFREANNLERLNPPIVHCQIEKMSSTEMKQGTTIDYRLKIHGVPAKWRTEIDEWQPPYKFVDNQILGPYRFWRHTHEFRPFCGGTLLVDRVRYKLPLGYAGWILGGKWIRHDIETIFSFRRKYIASLDMPRKI